MKITLNNNIHMSEKSKRIEEIENNVLVKENHRGNSTENIENSPTGRSQAIHYYSDEKCENDKRNKIPAFHPLIEDEENIYLSPPV